MMLDFFHLTGNQVLILLRRGTIDVEWTNTFNPRNTLSRLDY